MKVNRLALVVILAGCLFLVWVLIKPAIFGDSSGSEGLDMPGSAPEEVREVPQLPDRVISAGGPATPNQQPLDEKEAVLYGQPRAADPYYNDQEPATHDERLRHPERMFQAAAQPETGDIAVDGGLASFRGVASGRDAAQMFSPEMAQNGGEFMEGIMANDGELGNYSSI